MRNVYPGTLVPNAFSRDVTFFSSVPFKSTWRHEQEVGKSRPEVTTDRAFVYQIGLCHHLLSGLRLKAFQLPLRVIQLD
jgi:hypothetical protein